MMRMPVQPGRVALLCGLVVCVSSAQQAARQTANSSSAQPPAKAHHARKLPRTLTTDDRLSVIAAALDPKVRRYAGHDCSHLVHAIYEKAGFPYTYASSYDLYDGVEGFESVTQPQPGDLVVWEGHVGIVIRPSRHVFFSFMTAGPGIDDYQGPYWVGRGQPRFFHYLKKNPCPGCASRGKIAALK
jgi:cell wall-associated NlpC family hydrolase